MRTVTSDPALLVRVWESHGILLLVCGFAGLIGVVFAVRYIRLRYLTAISRLVEQLAMAVRAERLVTLPVEGGHSQKALARAANALLEEGIYVIGFFFPVVPKEQARIRVQLSAAHSSAQIDAAIAAFTKVGKSMGVI